MVLVLVRVLVLVSPGAEGAWESRSRGSAARASAQAEEASDPSPWRCGARAGRRPRATPPPLPAGCRRSAGAWALRQLEALRPSVSIPTTSSEAPEEVTCERQAAPRAPRGTTTTLPRARGNTPPGKGRAPPPPQPPPRAPRA